MDWSILNQEQREAAQCVKGAVLVTAGAGSGKTRLLTYRILNIIEQGVSPYNILAITFTNKAANEMKSRLSQLVPDIKYMWVMTFHALCTRILRENIDKLEGYNRNFSIYDDNDQTRVIKSILNEKNLDPERYLKTIQYLISESKNNGLTLEEFAKEYCDIANFEIIYDVYQAYEKQMKASNALDFDDLLIKTKVLLETNPDVLEHYSKRFEYISVDEFQDTNKIQYQIVKLLASYHKNIFIVGDEDQSIYGWRGANINNIKDFIRDFDAKIFKLEQNYRSTKKILEAANRLISYNTGRIPKKLWTTNEDGVKIERYTAFNESEESEYVASTIRSLVDYGGYKYSDIAVLVRLNALTQNFEEKFLNYNIPYDVFGTIKFYNRKEIKDIIAYLTIIANPNDDNAVLRVINFPKRGIGDKTIGQFKNYCLVQNISMRNALLNLDSQDLPDSLAAKLRPFANVVKDIVEYYEKNGLQKTAEYIVERAGIWDVYSQDTEENFNKRLNINQLLNSIAKYVVENQTDDINDYLTSISLESDIDTYEEQSNKVILATVHSVKGLEFNTVFITGLEEGIFPVLRSSGYNDVAEERRLMYVAITRARKRLYVTNCRMRYLYGKIENRLQSRFLDEMFEDPNAAKRNSYLSYMASEINRKKPSAVGVYNYASNSSYSTTTSFTPAASRQPSKVQTHNFDERLTVPGVKVKHKAYGQGVILSVSGEGNNTIAKIDFDSVGVKNLILEIAPLEVVNE
ncbi:MAG TPA: UvrD-helicase domain-containing protein [Clostridia bacterium]